MSTSWNIGPVHVDHPDAVAIRRRYMDEVASRYYGRPATEEEIDAAIAESPADDLVPPSGVFLLGRLGEVVAGCVGVRRLEPGIAELTRVFVDPGARRGGGGALLLAAAELAARERLGAAVMRLDTRHDLVEARTLYVREGYAEIPVYKDDKYAERCYEKRLA